MPNAERLAQREWLVIQHNESGRTCSWATGKRLEDVKKAALKHWETHECYPGEEKGELEVLTREVGSDVPWESES